MSYQSIPSDDLQFATWLVASRSFAIKISVDDPLVKDGAVKTTEKAIRVLLPYLDMINHSSNKANAELHLIDPEYVIFISTIIGAVLTHSLILLRSYLP